ncbi:hypothetical protein BX600DRAFT_475537 [Xylariales sp. PMI_506]|nr:hypothetical protein BX600DRAFT_475537 [Xylariales sp. PMI_506]
MSSQQQQQLPRRELPFPVPASLAPSFVMSACTQADAGALADLYLDAFATDPGNTFWWPADRAPIREWVVKRTLHKMADRGVRHFKVAEAETGEIVAFARWDVPEEKGAQELYGDWITGSSEQEKKVSGAAGAVDVSKIVQSGAAEEPAASTSAEVSVSVPVDDPEAAASVPEAPAGANPEATRVFFAALVGASKTWVTPNTLGLSLLCTAPKHNRRGAAKALLLPMLEIADANGHQAYLEATPAGRPMYEKLGFRLMDTLDFDLEKLTTHLKGTYTISLMIRPPQSKS